MRRRTPKESPTASGRRGKVEDLGDQNSLYACPFARVAIGGASAVAVGAIRILPRPTQKLQDSKRSELPEITN